MFFDWLNPFRLFFPRRDGNYDYYGNRRKYRRDNDLLPGEVGPKHGRNNSLSKIYIRDPKNEKHFLIAEEIGYIYGDPRKTLEVPKKASHDITEVKAADDDENENNKKNKKKSFKETTKKIKKKTSFKGLGFNKKKKTEKKTDLSTVSDVFDRLHKGKPTHPIKNVSSVKEPKPITNKSKKQDVKGSKTSLRGTKNGKFKRVASSVLRRQQALSAFKSSGGKAKKKVKKKEKIEEENEEDKEVTETPDKLTDVTVDHDEFFKRLHLGPAPPIYGHKV